MSSREENEKGLATWIPRFLSLALITMFFIDYGGDVHWPPWAILSWTIAITLTLFMAHDKKLPLPAILLFGFVLIQGISFFEWRNATQGMDESRMVSIRLLSAHATVEFLLLSGLFYLTWPKTRRPIAMAILIGGGLHSFFLIIDQLIPKIIEIPKELAGAFNTKGLLGNRSIGASFTSVWIFAGLHWLRSLNKHWLLLVVLSLGVPAILISSSGISYLALIVGGLATAFAYEPMIWPILLAFLIFGVSLGSYVKPEFFNHLSRYDAWPMFTKWYLDNDYLNLGSGSGTFKFYGPFIQHENKWLEGYWWLWLHNDWLQVFLEFGVIGIILAIATYASLLCKSFNRPLLFGAVIAYGVVMLANYPLHIAAGALLGFYLSFETWVGANGWS